MNLSFLRDQLRKLKRFIVLSKEESSTVHPSVLELIVSLLLVHMCFVDSLLRTLLGNRGGIVSPFGKTGTIPKYFCLIVS